MPCFDCTPIVRAILFSIVIIIVTVAAKARRRRRRLGYNRPKHAEHGVRVTWK